MPDIPSNWDGALEFLIQKDETGVITSFSDLTKYPTFVVINEQDARGLLEWFRAFYGFLVRAYNEWEVVELPQAIYLRDTYNDLATAYAHVAQFVPGETTRLVPINWVPDAIDAIKSAFQSVWLQNDTGEHNPLLETR